jgi:hypothetical protein
LAQTAIPSRDLQIPSGEVGETELTVHGTREMPVWGRVFRFKKADKSAAALDAYALMRYIESIQRN